MALRPESSVSCDLDEWGELVFAGDRSGPVIHRTPEELGIPATVADVAEKKAPAPFWEDGRGQGSRSAVSQARAHRDHKPTLQTIVGVQVRMAPFAVMGAEMIDGFAAEAAKKEEARMPKGKFGAKTPPEICEKILADSELTLKEAAAKYGVSISTVSLIRLCGRAGAKAAYAKPGRKPASTAPRAIEVDPERPGSAAALIKACEQVDAAATPAVRLELTLTEAEAIVARLDPLHKAAFLAAGLKAALTF